MDNSEEKISSKINVNIKKDFILYLHHKTGCGLMTATNAVNLLVEKLQHMPPVIMDNSYKLTMTWEKED